MIFRTWWTGPQARARHGIEVDIEGLSIHPFRSDSEARNQGIVKFCKCITLLMQAILAFASPHVQLAADTALDEDFLAIVCL